MKSKGSSMARHWNTRESAVELIRLLTKSDSKVTLDLQDQMVNEHKALDETTAGQELQGELARERAKWAAELQDVQENMRQAMLKMDQEVEEAMRELRDECSKRMEKLEKASRELQATVENLLQEERIKRLEKQQAARDEEMEKLRRAGVEADGNEALLSVADLESLHSTSVAICGPDSLLMVPCALLMGSSSKLSNGSRAHGP
jgi:hypothetical protein